MRPEPSCAETVQRFDDESASFAGDLLANRGIKAARSGLPASGPAAGRSDNHQIFPLTPACSVFMDFSTASSPPAMPQATRLMAWIDGAGAFLLCLSDQVSLGGSSGTADIRLSADLASHHATLQRSGEGYVLSATGPTVVASAGDATRRASGRVIETETDVQHDDEIVMYRENGPSARLRFRRPNPLTATAVLTIENGHRTHPRSDAMLLLADACVIGPGRDAHIRCRHLETPWILFRRQGGLWIKPAPGVSPEHSHAQTLKPGENVTMGNLLFRLEALVP